VLKKPALFPRARRARGPKIEISCGRGRARGPEIEISRGRGGRGGLSKFPAGAAGAGAKNRNSPRARRARGPRPARNARTAGCGFFSTLVINLNKGMQIKLSILCEEYAKMWQKCEH